MRRMRGAGASSGARIDSRERQGSLAGPFGGGKMWLRRCLLLAVLCCSHGFYPLPLQMKFSSHGSLIRASGVCRSPCRGGGPATSKRGDARSVLAASSSSGELASEDDDQSWARKAADFSASLHPLLQIL